MKKEQSTPPADGDRILVLDFGSQYTQLIARRVRESRVYCEIAPCTASIDEIRAFRPSGLILSGGPSSIDEEDAPLPPDGILSLEVPVLGICYGMQLLGRMLGGEVIRAPRREYGHAVIRILDDTDLFAGVDPSDAGTTNGWMSHGDAVRSVPDSVEVIAATESSPVAALRVKDRPIYGIQFHPEVSHTPRGRRILENFLFHICSCRPTWTMTSFIMRTIEAARERVGDGRVICGLSGGVDSSVVAVLLHRALGERLTCIFVDNGLLRLGEVETVREIFKHNFRIRLNCVDAEDRFLEKLVGVIEPEEKRRVIGVEFIRVFEDEARKISGARFLAQGTLYPDVIESVSVRGPSAVIKSHHNVGGLPEKMDLELIEPLRELFKDEVREVGRELGLPEEIIGRQPFPGPGLAVRIPGEVTRERLATLRSADRIVEEEVGRAGLTSRLWQAFAVLLPVKTVGVMGDGRTYEHVIALRAVESLDGMTADWARLPYDLLGCISNRIINEVRGVNRVVYDVSSKPPSTIEWE